ncbi:UDP-N-acetylglucosamine--N-acetylmuramyl-(pentapeptide) pyrophosphoryl-undecaprenol N-acetylglucosamine transferase [Turneriella parva]|uniref:UDP-N-acetylglucosamine--N-acetylmuramyl-(Pentapeptide) pyrophosphoryl-undecaprenol N-acetylglucosamine transferase n=1 Tax=Turneriella parva (strain ATCC BAA-1111 / DSM 21527 / NCTC 11395 / H) TaxID=869212 RepID=I4B953_TURPD|nr:glycosyltransferase [Turneriella parva]AFM13810.1 UDP-N-acetylglucosamine--N-acetylmuramyl-(pentapeptide) pyrophosphoryl-undecaprenol N-acetylglucosamine transferase [Turneriella parva DSM 21527]
MKAPKRKKARLAEPLKGPAAGKTIIIAAGGTGGHITPGISIAQDWLRQGGSVILATLSKNLEYPDIIALARNESVSIVAYDAPRLPKNPLKILAFAKQFKSAYQLIRRVGNELNAVAVVGMGGYSSFPPVLYAAINRKKLYLCEQNAAWGLVTRYMRRFASRIFLAFGTDEKLSAKYVVTGNPLRAMFGKPPKITGRARGKKAHIFFIGGSQGATDINSLYSAFSSDAAAKNYVCTVAAGAKGADALKASARKADAILPFVHDMPAALAAADFVVARCGSGTLFELVWAAKPAFLIPYPYAADDHQKANAVAIRAHLAATIFDVRPFAVNEALAALKSFLQNPPKAQTDRQHTAAEQKITRYILKDL